MAPANDGNVNGASTENDLAQISEALAHISKGENTAQALESHLTNLEKKIDDLLASFDESELAKLEPTNAKSASSQQDATITSTSDTPGKEDKDEEKLG